MMKFAGRLVRELAQELVESLSSEDNHHQPQHDSRRKIQLASSLRPLLVDDTSLGYPFITSIGSVLYDGRDNSIQVIY